MTEQSQRHYSDFAVLNPAQVTSAQVGQMVLLLKLKIS